MGDRDWSTETGDADLRSDVSHDELSADDMADVMNRDHQRSWQAHGELRNPGVPTPGDSYAGQPQIGEVGAEDGGGPALDDVFAAARVGVDTEHGHNGLFDGDPAWPPKTDGAARDRAIERASDPYRTPLSDADEKKFEQWAVVAGLQPTPKYDLRGYWKALTVGSVAPPAHGKEHVLPAEWVTPRDLDNFTVRSRYHPSSADVDVIDQRFPLQGQTWGEGWISPSYDMQGKELPVRDQSFTDDLASNTRIGVRTRSDPELSTLQNLGAPAKWSSPPTTHVATPIERTNIVRPPPRQRSHTQPRGTR